MSRENEFTFTATGDSMISRKISLLKEETFLSAMKVIQDSDVGFTNCEMCFHRYESYPMKPATIGTLMAADPALAEELRWAGFKVTALPNNHTLDYGRPGMFTTMEALYKANIVYAGAGKDLDEAEEPAYLDTEKGRVAILGSCADLPPLINLYERATNARGAVPARPGINLIRLDPHYVVSKKSLETLREIGKELAIPTTEGQRGLNPDEVVFAERKFKVGDKPGFYKVPKKLDVEGNILSIKEARRQADWVLVSFHSHSGAPKGIQFPDDFIVQYARACIDAGADAFISHGPHILRGIEIYKGKPIFYSLGHFINQNNTVLRVSPEQFETFNLDEKARASDFYNARKGIIPPAEMPQGRWWTESAIVKFTFQEGKLAEILVYPINFEGKTVASFGCPKLAQGEQARQIIEHMNNISRDWGTTIRYEDGIGIVKIP